MTDLTDQIDGARQSKLPLWRRPKFILLAVIVVLLVGAAARIIAAPVSLPFVDSAIASQFSTQMPDGEFDLTFAKSGLQLKNGWQPTVALQDVSLSHVASGANVEVEKVVLSWFLPSALSGKASLDIAVSKPKIQLVQDYNGIRLAKIQLDETQNAQPVIRLQTDDEAAANIVVTNDGVIADKDGQVETATIKSDNAWAIEGIEGLEALFQRFATNSKNSEFRKLQITGARIEIVDRIYQLFRQLDDVSIALEPFGKDVQMDLQFSTVGRQTFAEMIWSPDGDGGRNIAGQFENIDLALVLPFLDDQDGMFALKGGAQMRFNVDYGADGVEHGKFDVDISDTQFSIQGDLFDVKSQVASVDWYPKEARYELAPVAMQVGQSSTLLDGEFRLGLDETYGPTVGMSLRLRDTYLQPNDLAAPQNVIEEISFSGWSAPLYGAVGIDAISFADDQITLDGRGRLDVLQKGLGFEFTLFGHGATADDLKRIWPYFLATDAREWFVQNVSAGQIENAKMHFNFPVGTVGKPGEDKRIPDGGVSIEGTASNVELIPLPGFPPIEIVGTTQIKVKDHFLDMGFDQAIVRDESGEATILNAAYLNQDSGAKEQIFEISGELQGDISTLVAIANKEPLNLLQDFDVEYRPQDLTGKADVSVIATVSQDEGGKPKGMDYTLNGTVADFSSKFPIEGHSITGGNVKFTASQAGYRVAGSTVLDGIDAEVLVVSEGGEAPVITASATLDEEERKQLGLDLSQFIEGPVRIVGRPSGETIQVAIDLSAARLKFPELGIDKKKGVKGQLNATLFLADNIVDAQTIDLRFEKVRVAGSAIYDLETGLQSAEIVDLVLNEGDRASVSLAPIEGGFSVKVLGEQLDIKPMLGRFLGLGEQASSQATSNAEQQIIDIEVKLDRALGFYKTTAFGVNSHIVFKGADFTRVDLQASLGNAKVVSIATNPLPNGRSMSAASNDLGALLRFIGLYSQLLNGEGSLVLNIDARDNRNSGEFVLKEFSIVDEDKVALVMGNHQDSRKLIQTQNRVNFKSGKAKFDRQGEVITVTEAALDGGTIGGTMRGAIYTSQRRYDLVGTYIPLFGLNNIFQKLPLLGRILGGRDGEGLIGVTFAIRGELDNPKFSVNPASILAPGVFRQIFEFRAQGGDLEAKQALEAVDSGASN